MRERTLSILLITMLGGIGIASAQPNQSSSDPRTSPARGDRDDVQVTVTAGKGRLGIAILQISPALRAHFGAPGDRGMLVDGVRPDSPAARAGIRVGDVVTEVDGKPTSSAPDVLGALSDRKTGDEVAVVVFRGGQRTELRARLDNDPAPTRRSHRPGRFDNLPDVDKAFPFDGDQDELRGEFEQLRKRMQELERRFQHRQPRQPQPEPQPPGELERL